MNSVLRFAFMLVACADLATAAPFVLAPAVAVEAEDFTIGNGWRVVRNGQGNYMVDIIGFQHISGERLLGTDSNATASAFADITVPQASDYRLWVRYEYPPFSDTRFNVAVQQGGKEILSAPMGAKDNPRYAFGETARPQYDPAWGPEGLVEEVVTVRGLQAGPARIFLRVIGQPQVPGRAANRNIDLVYLTADTEDAWIAEMRKRANLYPILEAFRETRGPRYEVKFTNCGGKPATFTVNHTYNRIPWYVNEGQVAKAIATGADSGWIPLRLQDTAHYHLITFTSDGEPFDIEVRATGGAVLRSEKGAEKYAFFFPPYAKYDEPVTTQVEC